MSVVYCLEELRPDELEERLRDFPALVLPIGTIEWHSHHLPLGLDGLKAQAVATKIAERSSAVLGPVSWWAAGGVPYPYTLRLSIGMIQSMLTEICIEFASMGFRALVLTNGHYGLDNSLAVRRAALACMRRTTTSILPVADYELLLDMGATGDHAGIWETSLLWGTRPDLVRMDAGELPAELPGVIGVDPRGRASPDLGTQGISHIGETVAQSLNRCLEHSPVEREELITAVDASIKALETIAELRKKLPRSQVPPVLTPSWERHLRSFHEGRYEDAAKHAEDKRLDPAN